MLNKKAQVMSFEMVFITLLMVFLSITTYMIQKDTMDTTIISPAPIFDADLDSKILSMQEKDLLIHSTVELDWDNDNFQQNVMNSFFANLKERPDIIEKLLSNMDASDEIKKALNTLDKKMLHVKKLYTINHKDNTLTLTRTMSKKYELRPKSFKNIGFTTTARMKLRETITLSLEEVEMYIEEEETEPGKEVATEE